jgi:hypothetical protein
MRKKETGNFPTDLKARARSEVGNGDNKEDSARFYEIVEDLDEEDRIEKKLIKDEISRKLMTIKPSTRITYHESRRNTELHNSTNSP